jgi:hypothetical protein
LPSHIAVVKTRQAKKCTSEALLNASISSKSIISGIRTLIRGIPIILAHLSCSIKCVFMALIY